MLRNQIHRLRTLCPDPHPRTSCPAARQPAPACSAAVPPVASGHPACTRGGRGARGGGHTACYAAHQRAHQFARTKEITPAGSLKLEVRSTNSCSTAQCAAQSTSSRPHHHLVPHYLRRRLRHELEWQLHRRHPCHALCRRWRLRYVRIDPDHWACRFFPQRRSIRAAAILLRTRYPAWYY